LLKRLSSFKSEGWKKKWAETTQTPGEEGFSNSGKKPGRAESRLGRDGDRSLPLAKRGRRNSEEGWINASEGNGGGQGDFVIEVRSRVGKGKDTWSLDSWEKK